MGNGVMVVEGDGDDEGNEGNEDDDATTRYLLPVTFYFSLTSSNPPPSDRHFAVIDGKTDRSKSRSGRAQSSKQRCDRCR